MKRTYSALNDVYDEIETAIQKDPILNAKGDFKTLMQDEEFLRNYHLREMAYCDWTTGVNTAVEKRFYHEPQKPRTFGTNELTV